MNEINDCDYFERNSSADCAKVKAGEPEFSLSNSMQPSTNISSTKSKKSWKRYHLSINPKECNSSVNDYEVSKYYQEISVFQQFFDTHPTGDSREETLPVINMKKKIRNNSRASTGLGDVMTSSIQRETLDDIPAKILSHSIPIFGQEKKCERTNTKNRQETSSQTIIEENDTGGDYGCTCPDQLLSCIVY